MDLSSWIKCVFLAIVLSSVSDVFGSQDTTYISESGQVFETIFHQYNARVSPFSSYPSPLELNIRVAVIKVNGVDIPAQTMESVVDLEISWNDERLSWFAINVNKITLDTEQVWVPDIAILNAVAPPEVITDANLVVISTGWITWYRRLKLTTFCGTNVTSGFQECRLNLGSKVYYTNEQDFNTEEFHLDLTSLLPSHEWEVSDSNYSFSSYFVNTTLGSGNYSEVHCELMLNQKNCSACQKHTYSSQVSNTAVSCIPSITLISLLLIVFKLYN